MKKKIYLLITLLIMCIGVVTAQVKVKDGTVTGSPSLPVSGAVLELESTSKGFLPSRVALTDRLTWLPVTGTPAKGMIVYNTALGTNGLDTGLVVWEGSWNPLSNASQSDYWRLKGNAGTTPPISVGTPVDTANYWGTTDAKNLAVGTNSVSRMIFDTVGNAWGGKNNTIHNYTTQDLDNGGYPATSFMWGIDNIDSSYLNTVFGTKNKIGGYLHSNIIAGEKDTITGYWGWGNAVFGVKNSVTLINGGGNIVGGIENKRIASNTASANGGALFGYQNIDSSFFSSVVGGSNNILGPGAGNSIVGGLLNTISTPAFTGWGQGMAYGNAVFGSSNKINSVTSTDNANLNLVSGSNNILTNISYSAVSGINNIDSASYTLIVGLQDTINTNANGAVAFGTGNKTGGSNSMVGGLNSVIAQGSTSDIVWGKGNQVINDLSLNQSRIGFNAIFGSYNQMSNTNDGYGGTGAGSIMCGFSNKATGASQAVFGEQNIIATTGGGSSAHNIIAGFGNTLTGYSGQNAICGVSNSVKAVTNTKFVGGNLIAGERNTMVAPLSGNYQNNIIGGGNNIDSSIYTLMSGANNIITPAMPFSAVIGQYNSPVDNSLFLIGNGTGTSARSNVITALRNGNVGVGTDAPTNKLEVNGNVKANSFISSTTTYPDYVYEKYRTGKSLLNSNYKFNTLQETEAYINAYGHLPGVTGYKEVEANGMNIDVAKTSVQTLEKVEELYLHTIELNKTVQAQQKLIETQQKLIEEQRKQVEELKALILKKN